MDLTRCAFVSNTASNYSSSGSFSASANGGAIYNAGTLDARLCSFLLNSAAGAPASGGALYNRGVLSLNSSVFVSNSVAGQRGFDGAPGQPSFPPYNHGGSGSPGFDAQGGAIFNAGTARMINITFAANTGAGGSGGAGGRGADSPQPPPNSYGGEGGPGGSGGSGFGALYCGGLCRITNCTFALNLSVAGPGGAGGAGGQGLSGPGPAGLGGFWGTSGAALFGSEILLVNTLLATNTSGGNAGSVTDGGHNLSSDASCAFTNIGSRYDTDPKIGPLCSNGGPTLTMALLHGSPAIDAGDTVALPLTDQRGAFRPVGPAADIGAYEYGWPGVLRVSRSGETGLELLAVRAAAQPCRLLARTDLSGWVPIATNHIGTNGTVLFNDTCGPGSSCRFYRLVMP